MIFILKSGQKVAFGDGCDEFALSALLKDAGYTKLDGQVPIYMLSCVANETVFFSLQPLNKKILGELRREEDMEPIEVAVL